MKWHRHISIVVLFLIWLTGGYRLVLAEVLNRVVAEVNGDVITLFELNKKIKELTGVLPSELKNRDEKKFLETRRQILELLINEKIASEKIEALGIRISADAIDAAMERIMKTQKVTQDQLIAELKKEGISFDVYREMIRNDLEKIQLINYEVKSKIIIGEDKIAAYYNQNKNKFKKAEQIRIGIIFLKLKDRTNPEEKALLEKKAKEIVILLKNGADFSDLAQKFSQGPGASEGGDLGFFKTSQLDPDMTKVINGMAVGEISETISRPDGIQIIRLLERKGGQMSSLAKAKDAIYEILYREEVEKRYEKWIQELREHAYTKILL